MVRILGQFDPSLLFGGRGRDRFDFTLEMPGVVVETTGQVLTDQRVRWEFYASEAYPHGYKMKCRSLEPNSVAQKKLLGRTLRNDRATMLAFVSLVSGDRELLDELRKCDKEGRLDSLFDLEKNHRDDKTRSIHRLFKLLELTPDPKPEE